MRLPIPRYSIFEGRVCRVVETPDGGLTAKAWRDGTWAGPGTANVAELDFKGRRISEEEALLLIGAQQDDRDLAPDP